MAPLISNKSRHFNALMEIAKSVRLNTARTFNERSPASLYCLPTELICCICEYLPIAETFCLMISCSRFWHMRTEVPDFVYVQEQLDATTLPSFELKAARFHILRLMELDKIFGKGVTSFCYWACMRTHGERRFSNLQKPVYLKFSIEEQRVNCSDIITRSCAWMSRKIWVGICYEMPFAELRTLVLGRKMSRMEKEQQQPDEEKFGSYMTIPTSGCFSEHAEFNMDTMHLLSWYYLGRLSDFGLAGFDYICRISMLPICPHLRINVLSNVFLRSMNPGDVRWCLYCRTKYYVTIASNEMIELHISHYVGDLTKGLSGRSFIWLRASYKWIDPAFLDHCRAFSYWLDSMYNPETGAVYNGGQFEIFAPAGRPRYRFHGIEPISVQWFGPPI